MTALEMTRDRTALFQITVTSAGTPLDLTGKSLSFEAKESLSGSFNITKDSVNGITIAVGTGGLAVLQIDPADTTALSDIQSHTLVWDLKLVDGSNNYAVASGTLKVFGNVGP